MKNKFIQYPVVLAIVGVVCSLCLAIVYWITNPIIQKRLNAAALEAIQEIYPEADDVKKVTEKYDNLADYTINDVYEVYDNNALASMAYNATAKGYDSAGINYIIVVSKTENKIVGIQIIKQSETQGFGATLLEKPEFTAQFKDMPFDNVADGVSNFSIGATKTLNGVKGSVTQVISFHNTKTGGAA